MKKAVVFLFGVICYAIFFVTFLYAIGFVGNVLVPKSIDTPSDAPIFVAIITNTLLLSLFALQHTVMARPAFKAWWTRYVGKAIERPIFVLMTCVCLSLMYWQWQSISVVVWKIEQPVIAAIIQGVFALGWVIVLLSTFMINHFHLFGLKQVWDHLRSRPERPLTFQARYFYRFVRHPLMLGFLIAFWATPTMTVGHLLFSLVTTGYILISVKYFEEKDLRAALGRDYERYQETVPMLIPFTKPAKQPQVGRAEA